MDELEQIGAVVRDLVAGIGAQRWEAVERLLHPELAWWTTRSTEAHGSGELLRCLRVAPPAGLTVLDLVAQRDRVAARIAHRRTPAQHASSAAALSESLTLCRVEDARVRELWGDWPLTRGPSAGPVGATGAPERAPHGEEIAVIFTSQRSPADEAGYHAMAARMEALARAQPGLRGLESARGADGVGITVSYWASERAVTEWKDHAEHLVAQRFGRERWYSWFQLRVARVLRSRSFDARRRGT